ncbi:hypothetical protein OAC78_06950 [Litorivicinus sp.]|jgi:hypothetical protein|nr:hypothetical protein [Litorivicinus sp.]
MVCVILLSFERIVKSCVLSMYFALMVLYSATTHAAERPWWEADIVAEMAVLEAQNANIRRAIELELSGSFEQALKQLEQQAAIYLGRTERRWRLADEAAIRAEIERLNGVARPYFDSKQNLDDPQVYFSNRNTR